ncbi:hypothetical protein Cgig2_000762 [Carnegiea gigantea]|uniref:50S ribosomal protein L22, chloroplastic n=1 Tax=Carnegiea gigantea TaxID=171969 RepID=A0A9Q1JQN4_9CARY|nr:hypothetical protein Cgig2_000762 [Carnegiea gigantea]
MGILKKSREEYERLRIMKKIRGTYALDPWVCSDKEALMILTFMPYRACYSIFNLIDAARANAEHNRGFDTTELMISKVEVNKGTKRKKLKPQVQGRNSIIKRPACHITIVLQKPLFLVQLGNDIFPLSKKDAQQIRYAMKFTNPKLLDDIIFTLIIKGELKIY